MSTTSFDFPATAGTPPATTISELQLKTFKLLGKHRISPEVYHSVSLVTCAGMNAAEKFQLGLVKCLTAHPRPKFLSLTITDSESASLTLEKRLLAFFQDDGDELLLGKDGPEQIPITLDLHDLPQEVTGIVCGVASRLTEAMRGQIGRELFNMSYLSTAKAGHVIVYEDELQDVIDALKGATQNGGSEH